MMIEDLALWYPELGAGGSHSGDYSAQPDSADLTADPALIPGG